MAEENILIEHGIRPTAVRLLVWKHISRITETFALHDIERQMPEMDRSSIFRALRLFSEHKLLHEVNDGTGVQKYCICRCDTDRHLDNHIHFSCTVCGKTYCLEDISIPRVSLPESFSVHDVEYLVKGICPDCNLRKTK